MSGKILLDTNIVIAFFANEESVVQKMQMSEQFYIPAIVLGELYFGAKKSSRPDQNLQRIDDLAATTAILSCDYLTAAHYGDVKDELRRKGRPIPENDIWIAALTRQHDLTLITRDAHFDQIEKLSSQTW